MKEAGKSESERSPGLDEKQSGETHTSLHGQVPRVNLTAHRGNVSGPRKARLFCGLCSGARLRPAGSEKTDHSDLPKVCYLRCKKATDGLT